ncbi:MAG: cation:proton antiporter regulatory subunit [Acidimicrobiales bacterium]
MSETQLPGVGVRYEFTTDDGDRVGVILHRGGRRELLVYDADDPDVCTTVMSLSAEDTRTLAELLGATRVSEVTAAVQQEIEGLSIDWLRVPSGSGFVGKTIADGMIRTTTGVSIVAVIRGGDTFAAPEPEFVFAAGDVAVAVGTPAGLDEVRSMLAT